jgi:1-acyl-sn-glycerol-3-phosphate acyltransferase
MHHSSYASHFRGIANQEMNFVGKKELFVFPFGYYFRSIGGAPLDRSGGKNVVDAIVDIFNSRSVFRLGIAPEGTRKKVKEIRTGFYYIALKANVPVVPVAFDFSKKEVRIGEPFSVSGNFEEDMKILFSHYQDAKGFFH